MNEIQCAQMRNVDRTLDSALREDIDFLTELESEGLLAFSHALGAYRFDVIARLTADVVNMNGVTVPHRGFFFEVHYPRRYPAREAYLQWPSSAPVPVGSIFRPAALSLRRLVPQVRSDLKNRVATGVLDFGVRDLSVADLVTLTCFGINPKETYHALSRLNLSADRRDLLNMAAQRWFQYGSLKELDRPIPPLPATPAPRPLEPKRPALKIKHVERTLTVRDQPYPTLRRLIGREKLGLPPTFITEQAWSQVIGHIAWGKTTQKNIVEQGGWLVGHVFRDPYDNVTYSVVTHSFAATDTAGSSVYVEFGYQHWNKMFNELDDMKEQGRIRADSVLTGWYHTHPNTLDVFMSGTDMQTQRSLYKEDWNIALVLNPHRQLCAAFCGADAHRVNLFVTGDFS